VVSAATTFVYSTSHPKNKKHQSKGSSVQGQHRKYPAQFPINALARSVTSHSHHANRAREHHQREGSARARGLLLFHAPSPLRDSAASRVHLRGAQSVPGAGAAPPIRRRSAGLRKKKRSVLCPGLDLCGDSGLNQQLVLLVLPSSMLLFFTAVCDSVVL